VDGDEQEGVNGAESGYYLGLQDGYPAKNGFFESLEELLRVRGVTPELFYGAEGIPGLKDVFTPYVRRGGEHPKVNVMRAPPEVLQALLGAEAEEVAELLDLREELDANAFVSQVRGRMQASDPAVAERTLVGGGGARVVRVDARADVSVPRNQARVSAIVELSSEITEGVRVIRWFDRTPWEGGFPTASEDGPA
jgi:general secretion pathway protein K